MITFQICVKHGDYGTGSVSETMKIDSGGGGGLQNYQLIALVFSMDCTRLQIENSIGSCFLLKRFWVQFHWH